MTLSTAVETLRPRIVMHSGIALFNNLGIYHFCIAFFLIDTLDVIDYLDFGSSSNLIKYIYAGMSYRPYDDKLFAVAISKSDYRSDYILRVLYIDGHRVRHQFLFL